METLDDFGERAKQASRLLPYTEYDAEEMTLSRVKQAGEAIEEHCHEPRLDDLCNVLGLDTSNLDNPAKEFSPTDLALAGWSNWGAGTLNRAADRSQLSKDEFIILNDYFKDIVNLNE